ncbi:MAG: WD40 repeat domain-containing protein [Candidatus Bipolaricaulota bacterium]
MRTVLSLITVGLLALGCVAMGADVELVRDEDYHHHALTTWGSSWAVARGNDVEIWSLEHLGGPRRTLRGHESEVSVLEASPDGKWLAVGEDGGGRISVWELDRGQRLTWTPPGADGPVEYLAGHQYTVWALAFCPQGELLASGAYDNQIRLWDISTGMEVGVLREHRSWIRSLDFSPNGSILASSSCDGTIRLWDVDSLREVHSPIEAGLNAYSVSFSPDGALLATVTNPGETLVYETEGWSEQWSYALPQRSATFVVSFSPDGSLVATGGRGGRVELRDARTGNLVQELEGHSAAVWGAAFLADGNHLVTTDTDGEMRVWRLDR